MNTERTGEDRETRASPPKSIGNSADIGSYVTIVGIAFFISYAFYLPFGYDEWLRLPGVLGAIVGYYVGMQARNLPMNWRLTILGSSAVAAIALFLTYKQLVYLGGKPVWYDLALYPCFTAMNFAAFLVMGTVGLRVVWGKSDEAAGST